MWGLRVGRVGWPFELRYDAWGTPPAGSLVVRPLRRSDEAAWTQLRADNARWLAPWDATDPGFDRQWTNGRTEADRALRRTGPTTFAAWVRDQHRQARQGRVLPMALEFDGELVGQITVSALVWGAQRSGSIGYWVSQHVAGRGIAPTAVALVGDYCLDVLGLHRLEVCIRPENAASLRVAAKLGLREEGLRPRFVFIAGQWADHRVFAVDTQELPGPGGLMARWTKSQ